MADYRAPGGKGVVGVWGWGRGWRSDSPYSVLQHCGSVERLGRMLLCMVHWYSNTIPLLHCQTMSDASRPLDSLLGVTMKPILLWFPSLPPALPPWWAEWAWWSNFCPGSCSGTHTAP